MFFLYGLLSVPCARDMHPDLERFPVVVLRFRVLESVSLLVAGIAAIVDSVCSGILPCGFSAVLYLADFICRLTIADSRVCTV